MMMVNGRPTETLVDSGATVSIVNRREVDQGRVYKGRPIAVRSFDGTCRQLDEWTTVELSFKEQVLVAHALVMDGVEYSFLLSRPHMKAMRMNLFWDDHVNVDVGGSTTASPPPLPRSAEDIATLYPELKCIGPCPPAITTHIVPFRLADTTPVRRKPYPLSRERKTWLRKELQTMLDAKIIRPSTSTFASPITIAPKEDGTFRLCTDYRLLNQQTDLFPYPMPRIDDIINETGGCRQFSCIDLTKGYWQIPLEEEYKKYTAFITPFDVYEYNRLPFGWKNSGAWFQKIMDDILRPFKGRFCAVYIDDIVIYSRTQEDHSRHLSLVLSALSGAGVKVNFKKSKFFREKVTFLGRVLDGKTKSTKQESVARITGLRKPHDIHSLRVFLGLAGHFRAFIKDYAMKTKCLTQLTRKDTPFQWTEECEAAYQFLVRKISSDPVLTLPDFTLPFELHTDASHYGTGAVLYQRRCENPKGRQLTAIGYHSHTFSQPETNYTTTEKEALAVVLSLEYFRPYLEGRTFELFTDNQALSHLLKLSKPKGRIARWINEIQHFDCRVSHRSASELTDADALSRLAVLNHTSTNEVTQEVNTAKLWEGSEELHFLEPEGKFHVPTTLVHKILEWYHDSPGSGGHDGFWRTYHKIKRRFAWKNMKEDIRRYVESCHICQLHKAKYRRQTDTMILPPHSSTPFEVVHLDFAEIKKKGEGVSRTQAFLLAIDQATRMIAARPGREDAQSVINLLEREMFLDTKVVISDNGPAFRSRKLKAWAAQRGVVLRTTTPYHPAANGLAERAIRDIKAYIGYYPEYQGGWKCALEAAVHHHNRSHTSALGCSPQYAAYRTVPTLQADRELGIIDKVQLQESPRNADQEVEYRRRMKEGFDRRHNSKIPKLAEGDLVLVRYGLRGSRNPFKGPYTVKKLITFEGILKAVIYNGQNGTEERAAIGNIIPYHPRRDGNKRSGVM